MRSVRAPVKVGEHLERWVACDIGLIGAGIDGMLRLVRSNDALQRIFRPEMEDRIASPQLDPFRHVAVHRRNPESGAVVEQQIAELCFADAGRILQHRLEHRLQLAGRRTDDAQHVRRRRLLFERFGELARALLLRLEQPHVLERDDRLVGEGGDQLDLLFGETLDSGCASAPRRRSVCLRAAAARRAWCGRFRIQERWSS